MGSFKLYKYYFYQSKFEPRKLDNMNTLSIVVFCAVLGLGSTLCEVCGDVTFANATLAALLNVSATDTVEGYNSCSNPVNSTCSVGDLDSCGSVDMDLSFTVANFTWNMILTMKECVKSDETCASFEETVRAVLNADPEMVNTTVTVTDCDATVTANSGAITSVISLTALTLF